MTEKMWRDFEWARRGARNPAHPAVRSIAIANTFLSLGLVMLAKSLDWKQKYWSKDDERTNETVTTHATNNSKKKKTHSTDTWLMREHLSQPQNACKRKTD